MNPKIPLFLNGSALKNVVKENDEAPDADDDQADAYDPVVDFSSRQAQQKDANAQLDEHHVDDIRDGGQ